MVTAALGEACRFSPSAEGEIPAHARRVWRVQAFDAKTSWPGYPGSLSYIPEIELEHTPAGWTLRVTLGSRNTIDGLGQHLARLGQMAPCKAAEPWPIPDKGVVHQPQESRWLELVAQAQQAIEEGSIQKVVLARQSTLSFQRAPNLWALFRRWSDEALNCYRFVFEPAPGKGFISLSPERLMQRSGDQLLTEALAGTAPRPDQAQQSRDASRELLGDEKNRHEHKLVIDDIRHKLESIGIRVNQRCETSVLQQRGIQHLHQLIQGHANPMPADSRISHTLHPTAAIGGLPANAAREFLSQREEINRGWFAGYCGYLAPGGAEFAVTIRSAQLSGNELRLFAGAGIVAQSEPLSEWAELDQKIALPLSLCVSGEEHVSRHTSLS
ncbi:isochorismate synthase [Aestuariirhabdus sp. LZHN29]|uniref:isochorismate synthase n=1 Tax=Aestuariirhabdus sp. LZHN29 TaxID=3417462 RepID=UPI003CEF7FFE